MTTSGQMTSGGQIAERAREQLSGAAAIAAPSTQAPEQTLNDSLRRMIESVRPEAIFGAPIERDGVTIIPCAEVMTGFGMGGGSGYGPVPDADRA